jgi:hypothetical protein
MSTMRYSGKIRIRITYIDAPQGGTCGYYRCFLRAVGFHQGEGRTIQVGAPAHLTNAVDSPEAFDDAARAAIAFAQDENPGWDDLAAHNEDGYHIARSANAFRGLAAKTA